MARTGTAEIRINTRTLRIGHEVYPLANISRVRTVKLTYRKTALTTVGNIVLALLVGAVVAVVVTQSGVTEAEQAGTVVLALVALRLVYLMIVLVRRLLRRPVYSLIIETAGTQFTALSSHDRRAIHDIADVVVDAIENQPEHERVIHVGDVIFGDKIGGHQINQGGTGNTMNVNR